MAKRYPPKMKFQVVLELLHEILAACAAENRERFGITDKQGRLFD